MEPRFTGLSPIWLVYASTFELVPPYLYCLPCSVVCHRAQFLARCCFFYTLPDCYDSSRASTFDHICLPMAQIYGFCAPSETQALQNRLSACIDRIAEWMRSNRLQLNSSKTEVLWAATIQRLHQLPQSPLRVNTDLVTSTAVVRNLGIFIDVYVYENTRDKDGFFLLCGDASPTECPPFSVEGRSSVTDVVACSQSTKLPKCYAGRHP